MLAREKSVLGLYITRHPLASLERMLQACTTASTVELKKYNDGDSVILGGMVSHTRTVVTNKGRNAGKRMGIVTLEDLKGRIEAVVFPSELAEFQSLLVPDAVVFIEGEVDRKREGPSIRTSRVVPADRAAAEFSRALLLDITPETPVESLIGVLRDHRGKCPVYISVPAPDRLVAQIECHRSLCVTCTPSLLSDLAAIIGQNAICLLGPKKRAIPFSIERADIPSSSAAS